MNILKHIPLRRLSTLHNLPLARSPLEDPIIVQSTFGEIGSDLLGRAKVSGFRDRSEFTSRESGVGRQVEDLLGLWVSDKDR
jgi:hypothetical protein